MAADDTGWIRDRSGAGGRNGERQRGRRRRRRRCREKRREGWDVAPRTHVVTPLGALAPAAATSTLAFLSHRSRVCRRELVARLACGGERDASGGDDHHA